MLFQIKEDVFLVQVKEEVLLVYVNMRSCWPMKNRIILFVPEEKGVLLVTVAVMVVLIVHVEEDVLLVYIGTYIEEKVLADQVEQDVMLVQ